MATDFSESDGQEYETCYVFHAVYGRKDEEEIDKVGSESKRMSSKCEEMGIMKLLNLRQATGIGEAE